MSPPRRFYGSSPPGRLQATMLKVLAAEMSDAGRLRRGKHYFAEGAVTDITIEPSIVEVLVQGSSARPYEVSISVDPGSGVPTRREVESHCPCPDAERVGSGLCKHGVAALFALANEVAIEPDVLDRWRSGEPDADRGVAHPETRVDDVDEVNDDSSGDSSGDDEPLAPVHELFPTRRPAPDPIADPAAGQINRLLVSSTEPGSAAIPDLGAVQPVAHPSTGDPLLDGVFDDLLAQLHLDLH